MTISGLYTALSGLRAAQVGVDVAGNNVANAGSAGYTRQRVDLVAAPTWGHVAGQIGTGVDVETVSRLRDVSLDQRFRSAGADAEHSATIMAALEAMEASTGEPANGLHAALAVLWDSLGSWANDPADPVARGQVLAGLDLVASGFRRIASAWDRISGEIQAQRADELVALDRALDRLVELDGAIARLAPSKVQPTLLDERDRLLDDIAMLTGAEARIDADGRATVLLAGELLVEGGQRGVLEVVGGDLVLTDVAASTHSIVAGGRIGGLHELVTEEMPSWRAVLDDLATRLHDEVNAVNAAGVTADGVAGGPLLAIGDPDDPAGTLDRSTAGPAHLAAAISGSPPAPHDGSNAARMAALAQGSFLDPALPSVDSDLAELTVGLGSRIVSARARAHVGRDLATGAVLARMEQHAVSIDEEMVDLVRFQRALEAASRVMTTVDQALDVLVNRTGIVGR